MDRKTKFYVDIIFLCTYMILAYVFSKCQATWMTSVVFIVMFLFHWDAMKFFAKMNLEMKKPKRRRRR